MMKIDLESLTPRAEFTSMVTRAESMEIRIGSHKVRVADISIDDHRHVTIEVAAPKPPRANK